MKRINIIKHIEEKENIDIWNYDRINIYYTTYSKNGTELSGYILDKCIGPLETAFLDLGKNKILRNKSQIHNRLQYIKQSGYEFEGYSAVDNTLTINFK